MVRQSWCTLSYMLKGLHSAVQNKNVASKVTKYSTEKGALWKNKIGLYTTSYFYTY